MTRLPLVSLHVVHSGEGGATYTPEFRLCTRSKAKKVDAIQITTVLCLKYVLRFFELCEQKIV